jgi:ABC-type glycerol-3-phosphate transport system substrate-binding protein
MYYNRALLSSAGIPQPPSTWEAVIGMSDRLTVRTAGQVTRSLVAFGEYDNVPNARAILSLFLLQAGTPISETLNGNLVSALTRGPNVEGTTAAESALSFYTQFSDPAKTVYSWNRALPNARQAFLAGDLALYFGYASELPQISSGNPNLDFDMAPMPQPSRSTTRSTYGLAYAFAIPKTSKNPKGAYATAVALTAKDVELRAASALSMAPAARAALIPAKSDRFQPVYFPEALVARGWLSPSPSVTDSVFAAMIRDITSGRRNVGQALTTANDALNSAL